MRAQPLGTRIALTSSDQCHQGPLRWCRAERCAGVLLRMRASESRPCGPRWWPAHPSMQREQGKIDGHRQHEEIVTGVRVFALRDGPQYRRDGRRPRHGLGSRLSIGQSQLGAVQTAGAGSRRAGNILDRSVVGHARGAAIVDVHRRRLPLVCHCRHCGDSEKQQAP